MMIPTFSGELHVLWHVPKTGLLIEIFLPDLLVNGDESDIV